MRTGAKNQGFTLIELLIVVSIILILMGLIISGMGSVKDKAKILQTEQRMSQVLTGLAQYSQSTDIAAQLQGLVGFQRDFLPLRQIVNQLTGEYGLDLVNTASRGSYPTNGSLGVGKALTYPSDGHLPPNIGVRWENAYRTDQASRRASHAIWKVGKATNIESIITFKERQYSSVADTKGSTNTILNVYPDLADIHTFSHGFAMLVAWDDIIDWSQRDKWKYWTGINGVHGRSWAWGHKRGTVSTLGETLDKTIEIKPDQIRSADWYVEQWPNVTEQIVPASNGDPIFIQDAYAESDWNQTTPGTIPVVWHSPWGKPVISRNEGTVLTQIEYQLDSSTGDLRQRTMGDMSPLASLALLQAAGVVPPGTDGASAYRTDRSPDKIWNDAWGAPLVVAHAMYLAPRYDFDDVNDLMFHNEAGQYTIKDSFSMLGGRDWLYRKAEETYQYARSFYVAVGSYGQEYYTVIPESWEAADESVVMRDLWNGIESLTNFSEWTGESFSNPPWQGFRNELVGETQSLISTPVEIK